MIRQYVVTALVISLLAMGATSWAKGFFKVGEPAPLFSLTSVTGQQHQLLFHLQQKQDNKFPWMT